MMFVNSHFYFAKRVIKQIESFRANFLWFRSNDIKGNMLKTSGQYLWYPKGQKSDMFLDDENMIFYFLNEYDILFIRYS